nr:alanine racemase [Lachnospiraceae bacterium]
IKEIPAGTPVSYGGTYVSDKVMRIATVAAGYADGYPRLLSNKGCVLIRGKRAPILGRVCMDQFMVDVTGIPEAQVLDDVLLFGRIGDEGSDGEACRESISAEEVGEISGRFNYELTSLVTLRVPRVYVKDGSPFLFEDRFGRRSI